MSKGWWIVETSCFQKSLKLLETMCVMQQSEDHGTSVAQALSLRLCITFTHDTRVTDRGKETSLVVITRRTLGFLRIELERMGGCGRRVWRKDQDLLRREAGGEQRQISVWETTRSQFLCSFALEFAISDLSCLPTKPSANSPYLIHL